MKLVRVPLRISFAGGGSDIPSYYENNHSAAVLSVTIDKYIYITAKEASPLFPRKYRLVYSTVEETDYAEDIKHPIIKEVIQNQSYMRWYASGLDLDIMSDIPGGTGMGSSSAFTVGLLKALRPQATRMSKHELADLACFIEINRLKEPIGKQDQYAAAFGGLNYIEFKKDNVTVNPLSLKAHTLQQLQDSLHLVWLGGTRSASKQLEKQTSPANNLAISNMALWAGLGAQALNRGDVDYMGKVIKENWELKKSLSPNISNERVDSIIAKALKNGATGGKLLGAGGTGFVLLFCPLDNRDKMFKALKGELFVPFNFEHKGAEVLYEC